MTPVDLIISTVQAGDTFSVTHFYSKVIESPSDTTSLWREGVERIEPKARFFQLLHS